MLENKKYKTFKFLVEVTTTDDNVLNNSYLQGEDYFKENIMRRIMKALADYPKLVMIDVDENEELPFNEKIVAYPQITYTPYYPSVPYTVSTYTTTSSGKEDSQKMNSSSKFDNEIKFNLKETFLPGSRWTYPETKKCDCK